MRRHVFGVHGAGLGTGFASAVELLTASEQLAECYPGSDIFWLSTNSLAQAFFGFVVLAVFERRAARRVFFLRLRTDLKIGNANSGNRDCSKRREKAGIARACRLVSL